MNKKIILGFRVLFGLMLLGIGVMSFLNLGVPEGYPTRALAFLNALTNTGYMLYMVGLVEIVVGLMFLTNRYVALGAILLAPISVNIVFFHVFLDLKTIAPGLVFMALNLLIAYTERTKYRDLLKAK